MSDATAGTLPLNELRDAAERAVLIAAAAEAGIFHALAEAPAAPEALAERLGFDLRATRIVLDALRTVGALTRAGGEYGIAPAARGPLADEDAPEYVGDALPLWLDNVRDTAHLSRVLESGGPVESDRSTRSPESLQRFMAAMASRDREQVRDTVRIALDRRPDARTALDVGGGPGVYARELVQRDVDVALFDRPEVIDYVGTAYGLTDEPRIRLVAGDFLVDPLPDGPFDLALVSNITHMLGPGTNRMLFHKLRQSLAPGGVIAVGDFVRERSTRAARFAVTMLLRTEEGDTYGQERYASWLEDAGFRAVRVDDVNPATQLVTAIVAD